MAKPKGYVLYEGPSMLNGEPIVVIVTMKSANNKTGDMANMWIMHRDIKPTEAAKLGKDEAVCGDCPMRHFNGGACYVTLFQAPLQVFKSYKKGSYPSLEENYDLFTDISMRFGAYGDPAALPLEILLQIKARVKNNTSYTHQWRNPANAKLKQLSMASADSKQDAEDAHAMGWRTFRVTSWVSDQRRQELFDDLLDNEIICPNFTHGVQCKDCNLCKGGDKGKSIVIPVHGAKKSKFNDK